MAWLDNPIASPPGAIPPGVVRSPCHAAACVLLNPSAKELRTKLGAGHQRAAGLIPDEDRRQVLERAVIGIELLGQQPGTSPGPQEAS